MMERDLSHDRLVFENGKINLEMKQDRVILVGRIKKM